MYCQYKFKFYINASHAIYLNGKIGEIHPHTWEIILTAIKGRNDFVQFDKIERMIEDYLQKYQDKTINYIKPFDITNPTLENIALYLKGEMMKILLENGWLLTEIEVGETPARSYIITLDTEFEQIAEASAEEFMDLNRAVEEKIQMVMK